MDFFLLQDCVSEDYSAVDIWSGDIFFNKCGYPFTVDDYFNFIENQYAFLDKRNQRIKEYCIEHKI